MVSDRAGAGFGGCIPIIRGLSFDSELLQFVEPSQTALITTVSNRQEYCIR